MWESYGASYCSHSSITTVRLFTWPVLTVRLLSYVNPWLVSSKVLVWTKRISFVHMPTEAFRVFHTQITRKDCPNWMKLQEPVGVDKQTLSWSEAGKKPFRDFEWDYECLLSRWGPLCEHLSLRTPWFGTSALYEQVWRRLCRFCGSGEGALAWRYWMGNANVVLTSTCDISFNPPILLGGRNYDVLFIRWISIWRSPPKVPQLVTGRVGIWTLWLQSFFLLANYFYFFLQQQHFFKILMW